jgi:hypothetical protein
VVVDPDDRTQREVHRRQGGRIGRRTIIRLRGAPADGKRRAAEEGDELTHRPCPCHRHPRSESDGRWTYVRYLIILYLDN